MTANWSMNANPGGGSLTRGDRRNEKRVEDGEDVAVELMFAVKREASDQVRMNIRTMYRILLPIAVVAVSFCNAKTAVIRVKL